MDWANNIAIFENDLTFVNESWKSWVREKSRKPKALIIST